MAESILLVDDEVDFLDLLSEFLTEQEYEVTTARGGPEALELLDKRRFDMLLSDINMPVMKGFELLQRASWEHPEVKRVLITAYDVHDYIGLAQNYDIGNIITKTSPFNFEETALLIRNILSEEVFGLYRYVGGEIKSRVIRHSNEMEPLIEEVLTSIPEGLGRRRFRNGIAEVVVNAVYYGAKQEQGDRKDEWQIDVALEPDEEVTVEWCHDEEKAGVSVTDQKGRLTKKDILYWLERNITRTEDGLSRGFFDKHGKGLFITRETNDRFIINVKPGRRTEVILLNYRQGMYDGHRPLWIQEL